MHGETLKYINIYFGAINCCHLLFLCRNCCLPFQTYRGADKSLARPGRKEATATDDFDVHMSYLLS